MKLRSGIAPVSQPKAGRQLTAAAANICTTPCQPRRGTRMGFRLSEKASRLGLYFMSGYVGLGMVALYFEMRSSRNTAFGYDVPAAAASPERAGPRSS
jgi:hypothetical protein